MGKWKRYVEKLCTSIFCYDKIGLYELVKNAVYVSGKVGILKGSFIMGKSDLKDFYNCNKGK